MRHLQEVIYFGEPPMNLLKKSHHQKIQKEIEIKMERSKHCQEMRIQILGRKLSTLILSH